MNMAECVEAAKARIPVIHDGIVYRRISRISKVYPDSGKTPYYVVELEDKCLHSLTEADPGKVEVYNEKK